jgi:hypothetical protein
MASRVQSTNRGYIYSTASGAGPVAAQTLRTAASWAGAKAGANARSCSSRRNGPGVVLTAIGGGVAGYLGADWIADWIYED